MSRAIDIQELCEPGFGTCELKGYGYVGPIYRFEVRYTYPTKDEDFNPGKIVFEYAIAYRWTARPAVSVEMIEAMDTLMEVKDSEWAQQVSAMRTTTPEHLGMVAPSDLGLRHFLVYFDDNGCLEALAQSAEVELSR